MALASCGGIATALEVLCGATETVTVSVQKAGIPVTIDPFYATKGIYGQLYAALAKQPATGTFFGPQVSF